MRLTGFISVNCAAKWGEGYVNTPPLLFWGFYGNPLLILSIAMIGDGTLPPAFWSAWFKGGDNPESRRSVRGDPGSLVWSGVSSPVGREERAVVQSFPSRWGYFCALGAGVSQGVSGFRSGWSEQRWSGVDKDILKKTALSPPGNQAELSIRCEIIPVNNGIWLGIVSRHFGLWTMVVKRGCSNKC